MLDYVQYLSLRLGVPTEALLAVAMGLGVLLLIWGVYAALRAADPAVARIAAISGSRRQDRQDRMLLLPFDKAPGMVMKAFVPGEKDKRSESGYGHHRGAIKPGKCPHR